MNRSKIFAALTIGMGVACAVSCSSAQKKNTVAMNRGEARRTLASASVTAANGEVTLFSSTGETIVIQQGDGASIANVPVGEFKGRLKAVLKLPIGDYSPDLQGKLEIYRKADLSQSGQIGQVVRNIVREIDGLVDHLVDQMIAQPRLTQLVYSAEKHGFEFNVLRAYLQSPKAFGTFVKIPHGTFQMGSPNSEANRNYDEDAHTVTISRDFEMETTDVTQLQWFVVMGGNPSHFKSQQDCQNDYVSMYSIDFCPNNPVEQISWDDAQAYIAKLNQASDRYTYRLPTEAEWEYAARAQTQTAYYFGDDANRLDANAWYSGNSGQQAHAVAGKSANAFGLYDMVGNVAQWTQDHYGPYTDSKAIDPTGPASGSERVTRGGAWYGIAPYFRSAFRDHCDGDFRDPGLGVRLVRTQK